MGFPRPIGNHCLSNVVMLHCVYYFVYYLSVLVVGCLLKLHNSTNKLVSVNEKRGAFIVQEFVNEMILIAKGHKVSEVFLDIGIFF